MDDATELDWSGMTEAHWNHLGVTSDRVEFNEETGLPDFNSHWAKHDEVNKANEGYLKKMNNGDFKPATEDYVKGLFKDMNIDSETVNAVADLFVNDKQLNTHLVDTLIELAPYFMPEEKPGTDNITERYRDKADDVFAQVEAALENEDEAIREAIKDHGPLTDLIYRLLQATPENNLQHNMNDNTKKADDLEKEWTELADKLKGMSPQDPDYGYVMAERDAAMRKWSTTVEVEPTGQV